MSSATVRFKCPACGQILEGTSDYIGAEGDCPACGTSFRLEPIGGTPVRKTNCFLCYLGMFKRYVGFRGRTRRREFWWAFLFQSIAYFVLGFLGALIFDEKDKVNLLVGIYALLTLLPLLALHVRRLHDTNKRGWWVLLLAMPILNIAYLVWLATDSDMGSNRFGPDPKGRN